MPGLPDLHDGLQKTVDRRRRHGLHVLEQRRDPPGPGIPPQLGQGGRRVRERPVAPQRDPVARGLRAALRVQLRGTAVPGRPPGDAQRAAGEHPQLGRGRRSPDPGRKLLLLPAPPLQPLHEPGLSGGLPARRPLQAGGRRHRPHRSGALRRVSLLHEGLPLQENLLQRGAGKGAEVHLLLPPPGEG